VAAEKAAQANLAAKTGSAAAPAAAPTGAAVAAAGVAPTTLAEGAGDANATGVPKKSMERDVSRLGGPKQKTARRTIGKKASFLPPAAPPEPPPEMKAFLHDVHASACKVFGTTLGPEANADHRNHFHLDMAPRKFTKICD
jgi:hypothetical protein